MAANDYYNQKPLPDPTFPPTGYSGGGGQQPASSAYSSYSGQPPSYHSQTPYGGKTQPSPFETPFDDHVYPASTHQTPSSSQHQLSQQDSDYQRLARVPSDEMAYNQRADDIPLEPQGPNRNGNGIKDTEMQDHVYEAPQRKKSRKRRVRFGELGMLGSNQKRIPWVVYTLTLIQVAVFIGEIVKNSIATGIPIATQPQFNPMIGPQSTILINMGARFVPCMHNVEGVQTATDKINWPCPSNVGNCTLSELCGFGGVPEPYYNSTAQGIHQKPEPNQWFRFIVPMFLHAGLIHIGFNMLLQLTMGKDMEKSIGPIRFFLVYICSGIFGFVMGGNFAATGIASTGASGSLFGVIALTLLDLLYSWKDRVSPVKDLLLIMLDIVISFVLGLLPGLDNFSHIGGFLMGLALGICVLHSPNSLRRRIGEDTPYAHVNDGFLSQGTPPSFFKNPVGFFKGRKPLWWAWWILRAGALVVVFIVFILLLNNFYVYKKTCSWCKYLSCLNINNWCDIGNLNISHPDDKKTTTPARQLLSTAAYLASLVD
ncbi:hypothetical protein B0T16DRAFT_323467 [Cercophora newfieldiana]|uniref:Rhomboid-type serine protease n=1 Tax=Cercophora newfieldiana TaxID=92897 RepID=A0AA39YIE3_9PEZI|nr:hypothetical protein B0T16DRAFT_323467 [Cercophora newfieldiana]